MKKIPTSKEFMDFTIEKLLIEAIRNFTNVQVEQEKALKNGLDTEDE